MDMGDGGFTLPSPRTLCGKFLEACSREVARLGHTAGTWQRQNLNPSPFDSLGPETTTALALQRARAVLGRQSKGPWCPPGFL